MNNSGEQEHAKFAIYRYELTNVAMLDGRGRINALQATSQHNSESEKFDGFIY